MSGFWIVVILVVLIGWRISKGIPIVKRQILRDKLLSEDHKCKYCDEIIPKGNLHEVCRQCRRDYFIKYEESHPDEDNPRTLNNMED